MNEMMLVWIIILIAALVIEILTTGALVSIWFCFGAGAALIAAFFNTPLWIQILLFVIISVLMLLFTRPLITKFIQPEEHPTNADRIIGETGIVTEKIENLTGNGYIEVGGRSWPARNIEASDVIEAGEKVTIIRIEGVKVIVKKI